MSTAETIPRFSDVRNWGKVRGLGSSKFHVQYQRFLQEAVEIHEAHTFDDMDELADAIGDTIVTLINLAGTAGMRAEDCLEKAFGEIEHRKGLNVNGDFVRYAKLPDDLKSICDKRQGWAGYDHFDPENPPSSEDFSLSPAPGNM